MYFYFIWKHYHSEVVIFSEKESYKNSQRLFIQDIEFT